MKVDELQARPERSSGTAVVSDATHPRRRAAARRHQDIEYDAPLRPCRVCGVLVGPIEAWAVTWRLQQRLPSLSVEHTCCAPCCTAVAEAPELLLHPP